MTRWLILAALAIVLSTAATVALQWAPAALSDTSGAAPIIPKKPDGPAPLVAVEPGTTHAFGSMAQKTIGSHVFKVRNTGKGDLSLKVGSTTCKCTVANLGKDGEATVKPGEATDIRLEWNTRDVNGHFVQTATIHTNDPLHEPLMLQIEGDVKPPILMFPSESILVLSNLPNDQGGGSFRNFTSPDRPNFQITEVTSSRPELLEAKVVPLDPATAAQGSAPVGLKLFAQIKPSRIVGPFKEELLIKTDHPSQPEMRLVVEGRLMGPINTAPDVVRLPDVSGARGATALLSLFVRGQAETHFTVEKVPPPLKVEITPVDTNPASGDAPHNNRQYRLKVTVPKGSPSQEINEPIILKTDHPDAGEVTIPVRVVVRD